MIKEVIKYSGAWSDDLDPNNLPTSFTLKDMSNKWHATSDLCVGRLAG